MSVIAITPFPGAWIRPARRPKEMATADSPKDGEPPTVCGMPSEFQYNTSVEACQIFGIGEIWIKSSYESGKDTGI